MRCLLGEMAPAASGEGLTMRLTDRQKNKTGGPTEAEPPEDELAAEAAQLTEELPDRAAIKETHLG